MMVKRIKKENLVEFQCLNSIGIHRKRETKIIMKAKRRLKNLINYFKISTHTEKYMR